MRNRIGALAAWISLVALGQGAVALASVQVPLRWDLGDVRVASTSDGRVAVEIRGGASLSQPGQPDLPWIAVEVPLPDPAATVQSWEWRAAPETTLESGVIPIPALLDRPWGEGGPIRPEPDASIYSGGAAWPPVAATFRGLQIRRGRASALFLVCPFRWDPQSGRLTWTASGELRLELGSGRSPVEAAVRQRPSARDSAGLKGRIAPASAAGEGTVRVSFHGSMGDKIRPSLDTPPVEFLVITTEDLAPAFQPLIDWKNRQGFPAAVRTVDWISENYTQGVDLPERIRLFLRDAWSLWGTETVILGGEPSLVPIRYARSRWWLGSEGGVKIATDHYYACLDGNWNADGDEIWGESIGTYNPVGSDFVDLTPELHVGRVSAADSAQVAVWVAKYLKYAKAPDTSAGYLDNILILGEVLFPSDYKPSIPDSEVTTDGAADCLAMMDTIRTSPFGGFFQFDVLLERWGYWNGQRAGLGARYLNKASTIAGVNAGRNLLFHMGHGDRDRLAVGGGRYLNSDLMGATNGPKWTGLAYTVNCNSAAVDADCVGEAFQFSPDGGGVDYFGSSNLDFPATAIGYQNAFFRSWADNAFETPGTAKMRADSAFAAAQGDNEGARRFLLYSLLFLGDPDLNVWKTIPGAMQVSAPTSFALGGAPVRVTVRSGGGIPLERAQVCLYKEDDIMAVGWTGSTGTLDLPFQPSTLGAYKITVSHPLALPYEGAGSVIAPAQSFVTMTNYTITDDGTAGTRGNGNGLIESGETVAINLSYVNRGGATAAGVTAKLRLPASVPGLTILVADSTESIGDVAAAASGQAAAAFLLEVSDAVAIPPNLSTRAVAGLDLIWQSGTRTTTQRLSPEAVRADLELIRTSVLELDTNGTVPDSIPGRNEVIGLVVELYNQGGGTWSRLRGRVVPTTPGSVIMYDSLASFPEAAPGAPTVSDTIKFKVISELNLRMNLIIEDTTGTSPRALWSRLLRLRQRPARPDSAWANSEPQTVALGWTLPLYTTNTWGYRVYRAPAAAGPFLRVGTGFVENVRVYRDEALPDTARHWYRVATIDSSGVEGRLSPPVLGVPSPATLAGWPRDVPDSRDACVAIEDLNGWGNREIVVLSDVLHCFNSDGSDYYDGDHNPATIGRFTPDLPQAQVLLGKPAVTDLDGDGQMEIIAAATNGYNGAWDPPAALNVFDHLGNLKWQKTLLYRPVTSAPAVGNLDADPELEIVLITGKYVWAFNADGTSLDPDQPDGKLLLIPGGDVFDSDANAFKVDWQLASVALADLDPDVESDHREEIIFASRCTDSAFDKLYVINGLQSNPGEEETYGSNFSSFPFSFAGNTTPAPPHTELTNSSAAVGDFTSKATSSPDGNPDIAILTQNHLWAFDPHQPGLIRDKLVWNIETRLLWDGAENPLTPSPALGDVDGDGLLDVAVGGNDGVLYVVNSRGRPLDGFSEAGALYKQVGASGVHMGSPILADIDGVVESDGHRHPEVVIGDSEGKIYALRKGGHMIPGFPFPSPGAKIGIGLNAWDIDKDGHQNLVIQMEKVQAIRVLDFPACDFLASDSIANPWPQFRHDARNTGSIETPIITPVETLNLEGQVGAGDLVEIRWRTEANLAWYSALRREGIGGDWESVGQWPASELAQGDGEYRLSDRVPSRGEWSYRIEGLDGQGQVRLSGAVTVNVGAPAAYRLFPARPNPFNPRTLLRLDLPSSSLCDLRVVDVTGRTVRRLLSGRQTAGTHEIVWDGRDDRGLEVGSGIYFVRAQAVGYPDQKEKLVLLK